MDEEKTYITGRNAVLEALDAGIGIEKIYISYGVHGDAIKRIFSKAKKERIQCVLFDKRKFAALEKSASVDMTKTQGVLALVTLYNSMSIEELSAQSFRQSTNPILIALDEINDPHNLGAIARTAECAGANGIIIQERQSAPISPTAIKASAGALEFFPVAKVVNLAQALIKLKDNGYWIIGTDAEAKDEYTGNFYDRPIIIVIGNEGKGIRPGVRKVCDILVKIPLLGRILSLNASVSAAVLLYEALHQRNKLS